MARIQAEIFLIVSDEGNYRVAALAEDAVEIANDMIAEGDAISYRTVKLLVNVTVPEVPEITVDVPDENLNADDTTAKVG